MMTFDGIPVFIRFLPDQRVFEIVTQTRSSATRYDVDWCDDHEHYHAKAAGEMSFPYMLSNCTWEGKPISFCYWTVPHLDVSFYEGTNPAYCVRIGASLLPELLLPDPDYLEEFLFVSEIPTLAEMDDAQVLALVDYWQTYYVEEGEVIWCPHCRMHHDSENIVTCEHIHNEDDGCTI